MTKESIKMIDSAYPLTTCKISLMYGIQSENAVRDRITCSSSAIGMYVLFYATTFPKFHTMYQFSFEIATSIDHYFRNMKIIQILGGNNETVAWSAACPISNLFGNRKPILSSVHGLPLLHRMNQISDSS